MATHLRERMQIDEVADICAAIAGGLDSDPATSQLAPLWDALAAKGDELVNARRTAERSLGRARAKVAVFDAAWDPEVAAFGRDVVDKSSGKRDQPPYTRFFSKVSPSHAQKFGVDREIEQGHAWLAELQRNPNENLAQTWIPRLSVVNENLSTAANARRNALQTLALQNVGEELFIADVNREIDILEGELLQLFPGQAHRIAAFLEPTRANDKRTRKDNPSPDPEG